MERCGVRCWVIYAQQAPSGAGRPAEAGRVIGICFGSGRATPIGRQGAAGLVHVVHHQATANTKPPRGMPKMASSPWQLIAAVVSRTPCCWRSLPSASYFLLLQPVAAAIAADPCPNLIAAIPGDSYHIGAGALTGVNDADYRPPLQFTGMHNKLTLKLARPQ
jgi:hypothetical protein